MRCFCWQIQQFCRTVFPCHRNNHLRYFANTCKGFLRWHVLLTILLQRPKKREERYFFALNDDTDLCWDVVREIGKVELCGMLHISINTLSLGLFHIFWCTKIRRTLCKFWISFSRNSKKLKYIMTSLAGLAGWLTKMSLCAKHCPLMKPTTYI